jgi:hypothetical protein
MTAPLARTVLQMIDLSDQPVTRYVLFPPSGDRTPVAIDDWEVTGGEFRGYVNRPEALGGWKCVVALPADCMWIVYSRDLVRPITTEESLRQAHARQVAMLALEDELMPDRPKMGGQVIPFPGAEAMGGHAEGAQPGPGQYI